MVGGGRGTSIARTDVIRSYGGRVCEYSSMVSCGITADTVNKASTSNR